jgi:hypothetical protein
MTVITSLRKAQVLMRKKSETNPKIFHKMHLVKKNDSKIPSCFDLLNITITLLLKVKKR